RVRPRCRRRRDHVRGGARRRRRRRALQRKRPRNLRDAGSAARRRQGAGGEVRRSAQGGAGVETANDAAAAGSRRREVAPPDRVARGSRRRAERLRQLRGIRRAGRQDERVESTVALPITHLIDELATAYVQAIAASAGAVIAVNRDYGIDGILKHIVKTENDGYFESGYPVEFQLKGTTQAAGESNVIKFDLKARNYNLIVTRSETETPCYLFLVRFDSDSERWMTVEPERLILNAAGFCGRGPG